MRIQSGLSPHRRGASLAVLLVAATAAGCAAPPVRTRVVAPPPDPPSTQVYVYPAAGQTAAQLDRDRYECHGWAVRESHFDPSQPGLAPHQRVEVVAMPPPGAGTAVGAATGAVIGAVVANPYHSAEGAVIGAIAGGLLGATSDAARAQEAERINQAGHAQGARMQAIREEQAAGYRRALTACLEGRGYTVR